MTMRVVDVAPNEVPLTLLLRRLEDASAGGEPVTDAEIQAFIEMEPGLPHKIEAVLRDYLARRAGEAQRPVPSRDGEETH